MPTGVKAEELAAPALRENFDPVGAEYPPLPIVSAIALSMDQQSPLPNRHSLAGPDRPTMSAQSRGLDPLPRLMEPAGLPCRRA
jgi:hypothetical protein